MKQPFTGLTVEARGKRRDEHPTVLTEIALEFVITGAGTDPDRVAQALKMAEEQLCPVWAMLKGGTPITHELPHRGLRAAARHGRARPQWAPRATRRGRGTVMLASVRNSTCAPGPWRPEPRPPLPARSRRAS